MEAVLYFLSVEGYVVNFYVYISFVSNTYHRRSYKDMRGLIVCIHWNKAWIALRAVFVSFLLYLILASGNPNCTASETITIIPPDSDVATRAPIAEETGISLFLANADQPNRTLPVCPLPGTTRARLVDVNIAGLISASRKEIDQLRIDLFEDIILVGNIDSIVIRSGREFTLAGILDGKACSSFLITMNDTFVSGGFRAGDGRHFELYYDAKEQCHAVAEINDLQAIPPRLIDDLDEPSKAPSYEERLQALSVAPEASDDGSVFDFMILYTPAARDAAGGTAAIHSIIDRAVDGMNQIFKNSGVTPRARLVHKQEINYTELRNAAGGVMDHEDRAALENMDEVKNLRDQYGADMVSFFTVGIGSGVLVWPYSLTGWNSANSSYTFAHEAGHGMGCHHAVGDTWDGNPPGQAKGSGKFPYSHGWHLFIGSQRYSTIMAYPTPDNYRYSTWAIQIPYYSNPDVLYNGVSTGNRINGEDDANNARSINEMATTIAKWKTSKANPPAPTNVVASEVGDYSDKIRISWSYATGAVYYRVYRYDTPGDTPEAVSEWQTYLRFDDTTAIPWQTYWYVVKSAKSNTGSLPSDFSAADSGGRSMPAPKVNASGGTYSDYILVKWDEVMGAHYYRLWRSDTPTGEKTALTNWTTARTFQDRNTTVLVKYYYWVQAAVGVNAGQSDYSEQEYGWRMFPPPTGVTATDGTYTDRVVVTWPAVEGAKYYRVYRSESQTSTKTAISGWIAATSFNDTSAVPQKVYYYWVSACVNSTGFDATNYSDFSTGWRDTPPTPTPRAPISNTPTPHYELATKTPITFATKQPTFQLVTPTRTPTSTRTPTMTRTPTPLQTPTPIVGLAIGGGSFQADAWKLVQIPIRVQELVDADSIYFEINYDTSRLIWNGEFSVENTLLSLWKAVSVQPISSSSKRLVFAAAAFGAQPVSGNGSLVVLTFIAKGSSSSSLSASSLGRIQFSQFNDDVKNAKSIPIEVTVLNKGTQQKGDVNGDGKLTADDAQMAFNIVAKKISPNDYQTWAADYNNDGKVTAADAQAIYETVLQQGRF